jgi:DNA adenine methylase
MVFKYPGSKKRLASWIVSQFPDNYEDLVYLEPFFGSGSVFFEKKQSAVETVNDIDGEIINFFRQIREHPDELSRAISLTPWARQEYDEAFEETEDGVERARRFLVRSWLGRGSGLLYRNGIRFCMNYSSRQKSFCDFLPRRIAEAADRLIHARHGPVQIECEDAFDLIKRYDNAGVLMYLDPPYPRETRNKNKLYRHEFKKADHLRLIDAITASKAKIIISGYQNNLYRSALRDWHYNEKATWDEKGNTRIESIWRNYPVNAGYLFDESQLLEENRERMAYGD